MLAAGVAGVLDSELVWRDTGFALATGWDGERYTGLAIPGTAARPPEVTDSLLIVQPDRALAQLRDDDARRQPDPGTTDTPTVDHRWRRPRRTAQPTAAPGSGTLVPFLRGQGTSPDRYAGDFAKLAQEVVAQLAAVEGVQLEVRVEITARTPGGFDEAKVRTVRENAAVLKFDDAGFEPS